VSRTPHPVEAILAPLLDPAADKASLLAAELETQEAPARGLRAMIRQLEARHGAAAVEAAARRLMARLQAERGLEEPLL